LGEGEDLLKNKKYIMPCGYKSLSAGSAASLKLFLFIILILLAFYIITYQKGNSYSSS
jgi:hypothetical protein